MSQPPSFDPRRVGGIVFDLDGTLVDSYDAIADSLNHARRHFGMPPLPVERVRASVGHGLEALVAGLLGRERIDEGVRLFREHYANIYSAKTFALPGVVTTLRRLAGRGYTIAVASNKPVRFGEAIVRDLGMSDFLVSVQGPDRVGSTKPEPAMIRRCLEEMSIEAGRAVYVGDMVLDVETAARAGVPVVLVSGGSSNERDLRATGQTLLDSFQELLDLLPAHPSPAV